MDYKNDEWTICKKCLLFGNCTEICDEFFGYIKSNYVSAMVEKGKDISFLKSNCEVHYYPNVKFFQSLDNKIDVTERIMNTEKCSLFRFKK